MATTGSYDGGFFNVALADTGAAAGDLAAVLNPEGVDLIVTYAALNITTGSTGASTIDMGIAANATTSSDTLIDGRSGATAGVFDNIEHAGTNGGTGVVWGASQYLTASEASGDTTGLVGEVKLKFYPR